MVERDADFPGTSWGMVLNLRRTGTDDWRAGFEALCRRYAAPIECYARAAFHSDPEDARDLAQDFLVWLLEQKEPLARFDGERGSFRHYLKGLLRNFGRNAARVTRARKRGGANARVDLADGLAFAPEAGESELDRAWLSELTRRATDRLRKKLESGRHAIRWRAFEARDLAADPKPSYADVAASLSIKEDDVRNHLHWVREKLRDEVRAELAETVSGPDQLDAEWRSLVGR